MKFDVGFPGNTHIPWATPVWSRTLTAEDWKRMVPAMDRMGFHAIPTSEHFAMPLETVPHYGPYWQHALSVLAFLAGLTEHLRLDATVLVLPYHHPLALAKALATIDVLSAGRLNVSVAVGHLPTEFRALGIPFEERGAIGDEVLEAVTTLWRDEEPVHHGRYFHIEGLAFEPKPLQRPRPPIYVGGNSKPALRRAARWDGWQPNGTLTDLPSLAPMYDYLRSQPEFEGKEGTFDLFFPPPPVVADPPPPFGDASGPQLSAYREQLLEAIATQHVAAGVTRTFAPMTATRSADEFLENLEWFATEVMPYVPA